jgi:hypothetical protein
VILGDTSRIPFSGVLVRRVILGDTSRIPFSGVPVKLVEVKAKKAGG